MRHTKQILIALGIGAALAGGGVGVAAATGSSSATRSSNAAQPVAVPAGSGSVNSSATANGSATVNATTAVVDGKSEQVLVDSRGLPLYTYGRDTSTQSRVSGSLAALWPPLVSASPTESGATGKLTVLSDANGLQVLYNGHFLYTFVNDTPGQVTGQGVQDFFVATPDVASGSAKAAPSPAPAQNNPYGY
jgi:predicted lipoprotein with Yx(FWY)xxD motif